MALPEHFLLIYGYALLFAWVLVEQLGLPLPAMPALLAAGALSAQHQLSLSLALLAGLAASLMADSTWFLIGRHYGLKVLRLLCKLSLEPTVCVRRTQISFGRHRNSTLVIAKFVPGLSMMISPIAGQNGMSYARFLFLDGIGSALWVGTLLAAGRFLGDLLQRNPSLLGWVGRFSGALLLLVTLGLFVGRLVRRRMILKKLAAARLEPEELKNWIDSSEPVYVVDLRDPHELIAEPFTLPGALHFAPHDLTARHHEIPRDRDIVLFCSCPSEATAAKTALTLFRLGIERVRPLRGGYDEWKRLGFPLDSVLSAAQPAE